MPGGKPDPTLARCAWPGIEDAEYTRYHDEEWGVPLRDERRLFEKLVLEGFQSGLSWLTILRKRDNFRRAFAEFDVEKIAAFGPADVERLMTDVGIVRNRAKIEATIDNARAYVKLADAGGTLFSLIQEATGPLHPSPVRHRGADVPGATDASKRASKALKTAGFRFVGPTTVYAFMQSTGMVNDHLANCHRHGPCAELQQRAATRAQLASSKPPPGTRRPSPRRAG